MILTGEQLVNTLQRIISKFFQKPNIPDEMTDDCSLEISKINYKRLYGLIPPVMAAVALIVAVYLFNAFKYGVTAHSIAYIVTDSLYLLFLIVFYIVLRKRRLPEKKQSNPLVYLIFAVSLLWAAVLSLLDQEGYTSMTTYIMAVLLLSIVFIIKPQPFIIMLMAVFIPLLAVLPVFQPNTTILLGGYINSLFSTLLAVIISRSAYRSRMESIAGAKMLEAESVKTHEAIESFEMLWANVECGISLVDAETRKIIDINPVTARMFGRDRSEIIGKRCHKFICMADECSCPIMDKNQTVDRSERVFLDAEGNKIPIIKSVAKATHKGRLVLIESFTDISELKKAEEKLRLMDIAEKANQAKSSFLSRMSHEMRTPMNAIIGMTKIAENTEDISKLKHCISVIETSSIQLLGIINDVLDMSKIEAGKFVLENVPMNIEKTLMKVCNIIIDAIEKKNQKLNVVIGNDLHLHYIADDLRLSQVITNLLSNAIKFTPENGKITLTVDEAGQQGNICTLRFSVTDTGIGMTPDQTTHLFGAFEQADGSITRRFGGTGLGLAISKTIVEKMDGRIWVESKYGAGSTFIFEVKLERAPHQETVICDGIRPENLRLLVVESDDDIRKRFISITQNFGIETDIAANAGDALRFVDMARNDKRPYDMIFLAYELESSPSAVNGIDFAKQINGKIDRNTVIIITTFLEWSRIEKEALVNDISHYITKPLFPSSVLDSINEVVGNTLKTLEIKTCSAEPRIDLSGVHILLVEDVEINREIFLALLEDTHVAVDCAENGLVAVSKFKENTDVYDLIIMDVQMPEMDGCQATRAIRAMDVPRAKTIPIIAMTANAFREDIDRCLECGMNDHLAKPIDEKSIMKKGLFYSGRARS